MMAHIWANTVSLCRQVSATGQEPSSSQPSVLTSMCLDAIAISPNSRNGASVHEIQPCTELVEQWISLLYWADSFFARQSKLALLNYLHRYLDFIILQIGLHKGSVHIVRLLTLCAFAIAYANQGQTFTVDSLALFASAFDWHKPTACFLSLSARGLLTAACDPNFRRFAVQHRWHERSESALVLLLHACVGPKTTRLLNAVLSCLEGTGWPLRCCRRLPCSPPGPLLERRASEPGPAALR